MSTQPVRCQKCGKPVGYITVLSKGLMGMQQKLENLKIVAICMECYQKK
jgi:DNA-directed RNA polymerase subunit N (RpoN/RPB10)